MGSILENYDPLARLLLQVLLNSLWQGALIVVLVLCLFRVLGRVSATTRHAIWFVGLLAIAALPLLPASAQKITLPAAPANSHTQVTLTLSRRHFSVAVAERERPPVEHSSGGRTTEAASAGTSEALTDLSAAAPLATTADQRTGPSWLDRWSAKVFTGRLPLALVAVWLVVCGWMLWRILRSYYFLFRLRRELCPLPYFQRQRVQRMVTIFGFKRRVRIRTSTLVSMPMTVGGMRPLIVLPEGLIASLSQPEFESVVAHELAHIKRWDYLTNLLQHFIESYLFFHPAVWIIGKQLAIERELACDDWAVRMTGEPRRYASCLTKLAELLADSKPLAVATGIIFGKHVVSRRIEMLLNTNRNATTFVSKPALLYAIGLAVLSISVCSFISPVIAVPLTQSRAVAGERASTPAPAATQAPKSSPAKGPATAPSTAVATTAARAASAELDDELAPLPPLPPVAFEPDEPILATTPRAPVAAVMPLPLAEPRPAIWAEPAPAPRAMAMTAPRMATVAMDDWDLQVAAAKTLGSEKSETPAISETELLSVLTEIVKKDTDPAVRNEALQGIYRFRTDAGINTLIQLYDSVADAKLKGEIMGNLLRRKGDNSKAIAKLAAIAKTEKDDELRSRALSQLAYLKGDEGADQLIAVYDSLQDAKMKQRVIRSLAYNKSRKAIDKLIQIAKNDADPAIRLAAIRSLSNIDQRLYLELLDKANQRISLDGQMRLEIEVPFAVGRGRTPQAPQPARSHE